MFGRHRPHREYDFTHDDERPRARPTQRTHGPQDPADPTPPNLAHAACTESEQDMYDPIQRPPPRLIRQRSWEQTAEDQPRDRAQELCPRGRESRHEPLRPSDLSSRDASREEAHPPVIIRRPRSHWSPLDHDEWQRRPPPPPSRSPPPVARPTRWSHHPFLRPDERLAPASRGPRRGPRWDSAHPTLERRRPDDVHPREVDKYTEEEERSPSPDPMLDAFLSQAQAKEMHTSQEAERLFSTGVGKKSRFQKEKEEAERRRKLAEEEAAEVYKDFLASFDHPSQRSGGGFVSAGGKAYQPARGPAAAPPTGPASKSGAGVFGADDEATDGEASSAPAPPPSKRAKLNSITSELRKAQEAREVSLRPRVEEGDSVTSILSGKKTSIYSHASQEAAKDTTTTNVCIHSLPNGVDEAILGNHFCQFGDVGTVKIMWPRSSSLYPKTSSAPGPNSSAACTAFIAFMQRSAAELAIQRSNGSMWRGSYLEVGWGRAVSLPPTPAFPLASHAPSPEPDGRKTSEQSDAALMSRHQQVASIMATRPDECLRVEEVAKQVHARGLAYEKQINAQLAAKPEYSFLTDPTSYAGQYYRMLLDKDCQPLMSAQPFLDTGAQGVYDADSEEEREEESIRQSSSSSLGRLAHERFEAMLRALTPRRERIARAMQFAIEHSCASVAVSGTLINSLLLPGTPIPRKLARLWVVNDILHNSGPGAGTRQTWRYRDIFAERLPNVLAHWGEVAYSFPGRIKQESIRLHVNLVIDTWERALIFPPPLIDTFRRALDTGMPNGVLDFKATPYDIHEDGDKGDADAISLPMVPPSTIESPHEESTRVVGGRPLSPGGVPEENPVRPSIS